LLPRHCHPGIVGHKPHEGAIIFSDLVGKLEVLNVECDKWSGSELFTSITSSSAMASTPRFLPDLRR